MPTETVTGKAWKQERKQKEDKGKQVKTKPSLHDTQFLTFAAQMEIYQQTLVVRIAFVWKGRLRFFRFWPIFHSNTYPLRNLHRPFWWYIYLRISWGMVIKYTRPSGNETWQLSILYFIGLGKIIELKENWCPFKDDFLMEPSFAGDIFQPVMFDDTRGGNDHPPSAPDTSHQQHRLLWGLRSFQRFWASKIDSTYISWVRFWNDMKYVQIKH